MLGHYATVYHLLTRKSWYLTVTWSLSVILRERLRLWLFELVTDQWETGCRILQLFIICNILMYSWHLLLLFVSVVSMLALMHATPSIGVYYSRSSRVWYWNAQYERFDTRQWSSPVDPSARQRKRRPWRSSTCLIETCARMFRREIRADTRRHFMSTGEQFSPEGTMRKGTRQCYRWCPSNR